MDQQIRTTDALMVELGLSEIPRIVVFNKIDRVEVQARKLLGVGRHVIMLSATDPETTRVLLGEIAERLKERWAEASMRHDGEPPREAEPSLLEVHVLTGDLEEPLDRRDA